MCIPESGIRMNVAYFQYKMFVCCNELLNRTCLIRIFVYCRYGRIISVKILIIVI